jgi:hypothetical protein
MIPIARKPKCLVKRESKNRPEVAQLTETEKAIDYYNSFVEEHGLFGEELREF